ncbi:MAG: DNA gyrase inhibitor YacG [Planctomycetia bacterium]|nr:DNA gyrase inhibitor YacG [Planctomycetia bacterium]
MKCPICQKNVEANDNDNPALPFCSLRCKTIDAKRWLNEEYSVSSINEDALEREVAFLKDLPVPNSEDN